MTHPSAVVSGSRVAAVRRFNRFYTRQIGVLQHGLLDGPFSLAEARVLFEVAHRKQPTAAQLGADLGLDAGYLSRMLRGFERKGLLHKARSAVDGRERFLVLTDAGRKAFARLDSRSADAVRTLLARCTEHDQRRIVGAMTTIEHLLEPARPTARTVALRELRPGDLGWIVHRHGALYAREHGYDATFEALVSEIAAHFLREFDPERERGWVAEIEGEIVGSVLLVKKSARVAKLRLLLVEPHARGQGIGRKLVAACVGFAKAAGYHRITLWTQSTLAAARHVYEQAGFRLTHEEPHKSFGCNLVAQTWELAL
jgi:DNA-binding MarR family transcriptional regulator/N-acetylglutamate synthase-like GNAT family acetyltransferase